MYNSQELLVARKAIGLTAHNLAAQFGVDLDTARRWGVTTKPPSDVAIWVRAQLDLHASRVEDAVAQARERGILQLIRYSSPAQCNEHLGLTIDAQDALLADIMVQCTIEGIACTIRQA